VETQTTLSIAPRDVESVKADPNYFFRLDVLKRAACYTALNSVAGSKVKAAALLGIDRKTFYRYVKAGL
jgi:transcriptional regulator of acetoin/glycerol metabolism